MKINNKNLDKICWVEIVSEWKDPHGGHKRHDVSNKQK